jgi:hypothetical protein
VRYFILGRGGGGGGEKSHILLGFQASLSHSYNKSNMKAKKLELLEFHLNNVLKVSLYSTETEHLPVNPLKPSGYCMYHLL